MKTHYIVTKKATRPGGRKDQCFYCNQKIGDNHKDDCVLLQKTVKVRAIIEYDIKVPAHWKKHNVEFHRNDGTWCSANIIEELETLVENGNCLCQSTKYKFLSDRGDVHLDED